jgi:ADP-heptose:LPS heptosyltransferase
LVSPLRFIGDIILTVPLLRALRQAYPDAQIDLLTPKHAMAMMEPCPYINDLIPVPDTSLALLPLIRSRQYQLGISMRRSVTDSLLFKLAGVKRLIGFDSQRVLLPTWYLDRGFFLNDVIEFPPVDTDIPQVKTYLKLLSPLNLPEGTDESLELWANESDKLHVASLFNKYHLRPDQPMCVFHATSASKEKAVSPAIFVPSLRALGQMGFQVVALGSAADKGFYAQLVADHVIPLVNLCGETSLRESFALMLQAQMLLSLDSAPIHMAAAAGVPHIVGIYGPTNERQWRPYPYDGRFTAVYNAELDCRPCVPKVCRHNQCRTHLSPVQILHAVQNHARDVIAAVPSAVPS